MTPISVLAVAEDAGVAEMIRSVFADVGDDVTALADLAAGVAHAESSPPDLAFVDVGLEKGASLALVHHVKALTPDAEVYALARPATLEAAAHALSLGATGIVLMPPSGDELLSAATALRARRAATKERERMRRDADLARRTLGYVTRIAALAEEHDRDRVAEAVAQVFREATSARGVLLYVPAAEGSSELRPVGTGTDEGAPSFTDEMGLMRYAGEAQLEVVPLLVGRLAAGHVLLAKGPWEDDALVRAALHALAAQATSTLSLVVERERSVRGSLKDAETSAYTFAYFVDIAGREIDKAHRHGRRFALATISGSEPDGDRPIATPVEITETVLGAVRDSDVLARIDERELYLLLPETTGLGAHSCRRRVLALREGGDPRRLAGVSMGVAAFPHDGSDLLRLLRSAKRRADASRASVTARLRLPRLSLPEIVDSLLWDADLAQGRLEKHPETPFSLELPLPDVLTVVTTALSHAARAGTFTVVVTERDGLGLAAAVRSHASAVRDATVHVLDVRHRDGCEDLAALSLFAEQGAWTLVGRVEHGLLHGVHAADPLLADLVALRLSDLAGHRAGLF